MKKYIIAARNIMRTWFESFLVFELILHFKDSISARVLIPAIVGAIIPVALRWMNPRDKFPDNNG